MTDLQLPACALGGRGCGRGCGRGLDEFCFLAVVGLLLPPILPVPLAPLKRQAPEEDTPVGGGQPAAIWWFCPVLG